jgi:hypothetical protein
MVRTTTEADDESTDEPKTFFDKVVAADEGDTFELMGESLKVTHVRHSAASRTIYVHGKHEDPSDVQERYRLTADARYDDVDVVTSRRTDSHDSNPYRDE